MIMRGKNQIHLVFVEDRRKRPSKIFVHSIGLVAVQGAVNKRHFPFFVRHRQIPGQPLPLPFQQIRHELPLLPRLTVQHDKVDVAVVERIYLPLQPCRSIVRQRELGGKIPGLGKNPFRSVTLVVSGQRHDRQDFQSLGRRFEPGFPFLVILADVHQIAHADKKSNAWVGQHGLLQRCPPDAVVPTLGIAENQKGKRRSASRRGGELPNLAPGFAGPHLVAVTGSRFQTGHRRRVKVHFAKFGFQAGRFGSQPDSRQNRSRVPQCLLEAELASANRNIGSPGNGLRSPGIAGPGQGNMVRNGRNR